jgi:hypothetical protein
MWIVYYKALDLITKYNYLINLEYLWLPYII